MSNHGHAGATNRNSWHAFKVASGFLFPIEKEELHFLNSTIENYMLVLFCHISFFLLWSVKLWKSLKWGGHMKQGFSKHLRAIILYWSIQYNPIWHFFVLFLLYFCTSLFPDCLVSSATPALDLCCVVGQLPPLLILIMTTSGNLRLCDYQRTHGCDGACIVQDIRMHAIAMIVYMYSLGLCRFLSREILCFAKNRDDN